MILELNSLFEEKAKFRKFTEIDFVYLNSVYVSPEQIYGIVLYETEKQLLENWERAADELAVKIQSRLNGELRSLRWDMYLVLLVKQPEIQIDTRKRIGNDRQYFKKIVLTESDYPYSHKLHLLLDIKPENEFIIFNDFHFLKELESHLSQKTVEKMGTNFSEGRYTEEEVYKKFVLPYLSERGEI